jgi:hypothetical protein
VGTADLTIVPNLPHGCPPHAVVNNVVVDASVRGRGLGAALFDGIERALNGLRLHLTSPAAPVGATLIPNSSMLLEGLEPPTRDGQRRLTV